jgi:hypothetical protein
MFPFFLKQERNGARFNSFHFMPDSGTISLTYGQLLRGNRNFRNLLYGQVISELGNWFNFIAGLGLVRTVSDASPAAAGIFFVCRLLPWAIASPLAGNVVVRV